MIEAVETKKALTMQAMVQLRYGGPAVLNLVPVDRPVPQSNQVLVRVRASAVDAGVWHLMRGTPYLVRLMFGGLRSPKIKILGASMAGVVEAVGSEVKQFEVGDEVFGDLSESGFGAFAEYVCAPKEAIALKPDLISFEAAAATTVSALAALQGLRDSGQLQAGQRVLIHGAASGVGSFAVQIAKVWGAEVTGVCRPAKMAMVQDLGADQVIDSSHTPMTQWGQDYDLILDTAGFRSFRAFLPLLKPQGRYVFVGGSTSQMFKVMILGHLIGKLAGRQVEFLFSQPNPTDLQVLRQFLAEGALIPSIDRAFSLQNLPEAIRYLESRQVQGKVVIEMN